jgi:hypothetical protein
MPLIGHAEARALNPAGNMGRPTSFDDDKLKPSD